MVAAGSAVAVSGADAETHAWLRRHAGLAPSRAGSPVSAEGVGYAGREFRVYPYMRVDDATRFFAALHSRWDDAQLAADLATAGLEGQHQVRRLKLVYQRALVLALAAAAHPDLLVVENAEEFDEAPARELLRQAVARVPRAIVTFAGEPEAEAGPFERVLTASALLAGQSLP